MARSSSTRTSPTGRSLLSRTRSRGVFPPPYSAEAARQDGDAWAVGANPVAIATLRATLQGEQIEQSSYQGEQSCTVDGVPHDAISELTEIGSRRGYDSSLIAERLDETTWVVRAELL